MAKPIHSMIRVLDEKKSVEFYAKAFNLGVKDRLSLTGSPWFISRTMKTTLNLS